MTPAVPHALIPGHLAETPSLLSRFLPPVPEGVATTWLRRNLPHPEAGWVLDPFGTSPRLTVEAARAGYRTLVVVNNPILRLLLELAADPPSEDALQATLAGLAATRKGEERLEPHIRALYHTLCHRCQKEIEAEAFIWQHQGEPKTNALSARIHHCPYCGDSGEYPATKGDTEMAARFSASGPHYARALERIAPSNDPDRVHAQEALSTYLPRAVYVLFTLINKLDNPALSATQRKHLAALLLNALDQGNNLWPNPPSRARPRQLGTPPHFRENNLWLALEGAIPLLASTASAVPVCHWPESPPPQGGISIFEGKLKELAPQLSQNPVGAIITVLPRPNQALWTLSALWAGWLWGRAAIGPFKSVFHRRRYDWAWHTAALHAALNNLAPQLAEGVPFFGLIGEVEAGFLSAVITAAEIAGFDLRSLILQAENGQAQIEWQSNAPRTTKDAWQMTFSEWQKTITDLSTSAAQTYLWQRGEPADYLHLQASALTEMAQKHSLPPAQAQPVGDTHIQVMGAIERALAAQETFQRFGGSEKAPESGQWWPQEAREFTPALSDRAEKQVVRFLIDHPGSLQSEVEAGIYPHFAGLQTPEPTLIKACLQSYGEMTNDRWQLRKEDHPRARRSDLKAAAPILDLLAAQLGYTTIHPEDNRDPLLWSEGGEIAFAFYLIASAIVGEIVHISPCPPSRSVIVLPGGRASLVVYKVQHNPRLRQSLEEGWRFLKFRQLRWLSERTNLTRDQLVEQLASDPLR